MHLPISDRSHMSLDTEIFLLEYMLDKSYLMLVGIIYP